MQVRAFLERNSNHIWHVFSALVISAFIFAFGLPTGIFGGFPPFSNLPKGVDAYTHLTRIRFFLQNWPNFWWLQIWHGGVLWTNTYPYQPLFLVAFLAKISGWSEANSLLIGAAFSLVAFEILMYFVVFKLSSNRVVSLIAPMLALSSPSFLQPLTMGGSYPQIISAPFFLLSVYGCNRYIETAGKTKTSLISYFLVVFSLSLSAFYIWTAFFSYLTSFLIFLLCINGWKKKFVHMFKVFLPSLLISSYWYLPFFYSISQLIAQHQRLGSYSRTSPYTLDSFYNYSTQDDVKLSSMTFHPLLIPIVLTSTVIFLILKSKHQLSLDSKKSGLLKPLGLLTLFLFVYVTTGFPFRFMAFFGVGYWLTIYLSIYGVSLVGTIVKNMDVNIKMDRRKIVGFLGILIVSCSAIPFVFYGYVSPAIADPGGYGYHGDVIARQKQLVNIDPFETNYRVASDWRQFQSWFNFEYRLSQMGGLQAHGMAENVANWFYWGYEKVWRREDNSETQFWLDWQGAKWIVDTTDEKTPSVTALALDDFSSCEKFLRYPEYYEVVSQIEYSYEFEYLFATPIMSSTNATTILVVGDEATFESFFKSLAPSNYNSRFVVPIQGGQYLDDYSIEMLQEFDAIYINLLDYYHNHTMAWTVLEEFVEKGGGLIIENGQPEDFLPVPSPVRNIVSADYSNGDFTYSNDPINDWVDFTSFSSPTWATLDEYVRSPWSNPILWSNENPVAVTAEYGMGRSVWIGLSLLERGSVSKNHYASLYLSRLIDWVSKNPLEPPERFPSVLLDNSENLANWYTSVAGTGWKTANASLELSSDVKIEGTSSLKAGFFFGAEGGEHADFYYKLNRSLIDVDFLCLSVLGDDSGDLLKIVILAPDWENFLQSFLKVEWSGWKRVTLPIKEMGKVGEPSIANATHIGIIIDKMSPSEHEWRYLYLDGFTVGNYPREIKGFNVSRPNPSQFYITIERWHKGILFKENYLDQYKNWVVKMVANDETEELPIFSAGPSFIYVPLRRDMYYPVTIIFTFQVNPIVPTGYLVSILTFLFMFAYAIYKKLAGIFRTPLPASVSSQNIRQSMTD